MFCCVHRGVLHRRSESHHRQDLHHQEPEGVPAYADLQELGVSEEVGGAADTRTRPEEPQHHSRRLRGSTSSEFFSDPAEPQTEAQQLQPEEKSLLFIIIFSGKWLYIHFLRDFLSVSTFMCNPCILHKLPSSFTHLNLPVLLSKQHFRVFVTQIYLFLHEASSALERFPVATVSCGADDDPDDGCAFVSVHLHILDGGLFVQPAVESDTFTSWH